ncbi:DUF2332 domain-containing protein [Piscinibacter aquaticus]|uniref:DUF2332 domain-containing protein n=1 Tax=Piscinibacter aquaticus TaxID=392597 RepID=A0A5C6U4E5_9BURK|nr:DUF2332 domain-containing protein [Piscinibacter aquaticus]
MRCCRPGRPGRQGRTGAAAPGGRLPCAGAVGPASAAVAPVPARRGGVRCAGAPPLLRRLLVDEADHFRTYLASAPQTNEVMRSAVLIGGYAAIAERTGLPLALREVGASAGLNLLWDRFHYTLGEQRWGDEASPVRIVSDWRGHVPSLPPRIAVADRRGNDLLPIDVGDDAAVLRLRSYVWPDQAARMARLQGALALARRERPVVDAGDAAAWVARELAAPRPDAVTVLAHSVVWQYLPPETRERIDAALAAAARQARDDGPLALAAHGVLRQRRAGRAAAHAVARWRGAHAGRAHPHGEWVEWV